MARKGEKWRRGAGEPAVGRRAQNQSLKVPLTWRAGAAGLAKFGRIDALVNNAGKDMREALARHYLQKTVMTAAEISFLLRPERAASVAPRDARSL